ncbi:TIGR02530 family flagellar biosynthesis protein [Bacillus salitolerans]|uniref:TIGR02530 family flagellar biosynthesis protein n=1 Tax=Bacillus salitolerans TaxID=1437434 RepID=A0ABW4LP22_9BACI
MDHRIHQLQHHPLTLQTKKIEKDKEVNTNFRELLHEALGLKISKHAQKRLAERNIEIGNEKWVKLQEKMAEARDMGITESLVVMNQAALIVNTKNNTVITAMNRHEASSQIFTNINGTILLDQ